MFNLFNRQPQPLPECACIYINGTVYTRRGVDIAMTQRDGSPMTCPYDYVTPNGVTIRQIAYALAIIEGMITVEAGSVFSRQSSGIGLN
jgi:hypothetical protein